MGWALAIPVHVHTRVHLTITPGTSELYVPPTPSLQGLRGPLRCTYTSPRAASPSVIISSNVHISVKCPYFSQMCIILRNGCISKSLHGRMTGISTRRALNGSLEHEIPTIRLKARNVSALRNASDLRPQICPKYRFILRSFWCNSSVNCSGEPVVMSVGRYLALF